jgi:hypothetical protein
MMRCSDGNFYVVKFRNNPQHFRVLANELRHATRRGLPDCQFRQPRSSKLAIGWRRTHLISTFRFPAV